MTEETYKKNLRRRHFKCAVFRAVCLSGIILSALFLVFFFVDIIGKALPVFTRVEIKEVLDYQAAKEAGTPGDKATEHGDSSYAISEEAYHAQILSRQVIWDVENVLKEHAAKGTPLPEKKEQWLLAHSDVDQYLKNGIRGKLSDKQIKHIEKIEAEGKTRKVRNFLLFTNSDSSHPEAAGIKGAAIGTMWIMLVTALFAVPVGVMAALYLEEYAPRNKFSNLIEININNLAAIPSIIFGLLGLLVFLNYMGMPRSSPLVGGLTLGLMMLPIMIISTRASLRSVPMPIREAALSVGASKWQTVQHHVLPLALPGILTGTILSLAQAMGETAPLLMVGLNSFVPQSPAGIMDSSSALPTLIFQWAGSPERGFTERTAAAILVMLTILITMNGLAVWMRHKFERRW